MRDVLEKAITETAAVMRGVKPDQLGLPTPCRDWDVQTLANHLLQVATALSLAGRGEPVPGELWGRELMADGWADRFESLAAPAVPAEWAGMARVGEAEMPASVVAAMLVSDAVLHGWDLARATGQEYRCDPEVAELTYRFVLETGEQGRQMGIFAAPVPVARDAALLDRALGLSGRDPRWARPLSPRG
ncbi:TIGR03086 family metal-binding protein [Phytohabitans flavus]|uniref:TIGR03086 family protein n=1 Tax=Phytohabitans flavus TaxID=1076124 RepID=A0A6F8XQ12_9ACTN|nr:TIGR03086 family metal-binding protein [Phytohabitans flavus]BCB75924.1 TIGR03086 family protein [Phytohabitans flavus]